ncbi:MAG TPA: AAA family ATPase [Pyrinomonadaceae bacterium]|nr:AAA family ATPase [Pyrinomonadaceae bacterium]
MKRFNEFRLDSINECLWRGTTRLTLTPKAFKILNCLVQNAGNTVTKDQFMEEVWPGVYVGEENLKVYVRELRGLLGDVAAKPKYIETYRDKGYRFIAPIIEGRVESESEFGNMFGRERELAKLNEYLILAGNGHRQIVFITGEPGIGKTSLVDNFLLQINKHQPIRTALGQCIESYREQEAFYPVLEALGRLLHESDGQEFTELLARHAPTWFVQFPGISSATNHDDLRSQVIGAGRERMLREICKALEIVTEKSTMVLVLEDLHWTDHSTLDFIAALARRREPARLLLLATYRPVEVIISHHPLRLLKSELCLHNHAKEVPLELLSDAAVASYLTARFSPEITEQLLADVQAKTDGNPLFLEALMDHLVSQKMIVNTVDGWRLECDQSQLRAIVPDSLNEIINKQVEQLSPREQEVLTAASIIGKSFSTAVLGVTLDSEWTEVEECCDSLSRRHLLLARGGLLELPDRQVSGLFNFTHSLHREAIYNNCRPAARLHLHHRVGEAIEKIWDKHEHEMAAELARHFQESRDYLRVIYYLQVQATNAEHRYAFQDAVTLLELAVKYTLEIRNGPQVESLCQLKTQLARLYDKLGDKARSAATHQEVADAAIPNGLNEIAAESLICVSREVSFMNAPYALELAERALLMFPEESSPSRLGAHAWTTFLRIGWNGWTAEQHDELKKNFDELRRIGEPRIFAEHAFGLAVVQMFTGDHEGALQTADESIPLVARSGDNLAHLTVHWMRNWSLMQKGRFGEALQGLREAISLARRNMSMFDAATGLLFLAELHLEAFDPLGAVSLCEEALPIIRRSQSSFVMQRALTISGIAHMECGSLDRAQEYLSELHELYGASRIPFSWHWKLPLYSALTELGLLLGDHTFTKINLERLRALAEFHANLRYRVRLKQITAQLELAQGDLSNAKSEITEALNMFDDRKFPLVAWRIHETAEVLYRITGDSYLSKRHSQIRADIFMELADSLSETEPLHATILRKVNDEKPYLITH